MKLRGKILTTGAVTAVVLMTFAPTASAGQDAYSEVPGKDGGVGVRFISNGDKFEICDLRDEGDSAYVEYEYVRYDGTVQRGEHRPDINGGHCKTYSHDFGEGRKVKFRAGQDIVLRPDLYGPWKTGIA
ncbi:hypothetical protein [Streptomyces decoyicus]